MDAQRFYLVREALTRKYANANMSPSKHASYLRLTALKHVWPVEDALAELRQLTPSALQVGCSRCLAENEEGPCDASSWRSNPLPLSALSLLGDAVVAAGRMLD